ncbi:MAG: site-specific integrase [Candidatus Bathyarchaeota archaeon]|nr:site-specific integrase [Candidatus Bathyarchaeum sp.]
MIETKPPKINWQNPELSRWLGSIVNKSTFYNSKSAFRAYSEFTGLTASQLIDEAIEDAKLDPREKQDIVLSRLIGFYKWLRTEYQQKKTVGKGKTKKAKKGVSGKSAEMRVNVIRGFYSTFDITVRLKGKHKLPKSKVKNKRIVFKPEDVWKVKALVDHARTPRDRAIVLFHFQGGLDVSTLCALNYEDVVEGLEKNEHPLKIDTMRIKSGVEYYTFVGHDAIDALKAYLADMKSKGVEFTNSTPLFLQRGKNRLKTHNIQIMMKKLAVRAGFVTEENNGNSFNPLGTHSLRESFGSLMINSGVPDSIVDFWLGHEIGDMSKAYRETQFENLKKMYLERESLFAVSLSKGENEKTMTEVKEVKDDLYQLHLENKKMKNQIRAQKLEIEKLNKRSKEQNQLGEQIIKVGENLKKWQQEKGEIEAKIVGIQKFQRLVLDQPDEVILDFIKDVRQQLKKKQS